MYDVIVIGAGISGLVCGNFLAKAGKKVLILEHNYQAGGQMSSFKRAGCYFDCGAQSFQSLGILFPILAKLGLYDKNEWIKTNYAFILPSGRLQLDSFEHLKEGLLKLDEPGLKKYVAILEKSFELFDGLLKNKLSAIWKRHLIKFLLNTTHNEFIDKHFANANYKELFKNFAWAYGNINMFMAMGFWYTAINDYWVPKNGIQRFSDSLIANFQRLGGAVEFRKDVISIGKVEAHFEMQCQDEKYLAKKVVYTGDIRALYAKILKKGVCPNFVKSKVGEPFVSAYLCLKMPPHELAGILGAYHTFYFPTYSYASLDEKENPELHYNRWIEITHTNACNHQLNLAGYSSVVLQTTTNYEWNDYWGTNGDDLKCDEKYYQIKENVLKQLIGTFSHIAPDVSGAIVHAELGAPQSSIHFTLNSNGSTTGWAYDNSNFVATQPLHISSGISGLCLAGQWSIWPATVATSAFSGKMVANCIANNCSPLIVELAANKLFRALLGPPYYF